MKLKEIANMEHYLENECYCPGEIYDMTGFFFQIFDPDTECRLLCSGSRGAIHGKFVIATENEKSNPQIIYIEIEDEKVSSCIRIDATKHNIEEILRFMDGRIEKMDFDEFNGHDSEKDVREIMKYADAIMID